MQLHCKLRSPRSRSPDRVSGTSIGVPGSAVVRTRPRPGPWTSPLPTQGLRTSRRRRPNRGPGSFRLRLVDRVADPGWEIAAMVFLVKLSVREGLLVQTVRDTSLRPNPPRGPSLAAAVWDNEGRLRRPAAATGDPGAPPLPLASSTAARGRARSSGLARTRRRVRARRKIRPWVASFGE